MINWNNWYEEKTLDNGMKLWYRHFSSHTSAFYALIDAGSQHDGAYPGIAHFTEHMLFRGTKNMPDDTVKYVAAKYGMQLGAATSKEMLIFRVENILNHEAALDILHEVIVLPTFPIDNLNKERSVIISEIKRSEDDNARRALDIALARMVKYPFNVPILGFIKSITDISSETMQQFHAATFTPERTTLCYAGPLSLIEITKLCNHKFEQWHSTREKWEGNFACPDIPSLSVARRDQQQIFVSLNYPGITSQDPDFVKLDMVCDIIGGSMVSRMFLKLRNELGLCYQCGIRFPCFLNTPGIISLYGMIPRNVTTVEQFTTKVQEIINEIICNTKPLTVEELEFGKARTSANLFNKADNLNSQFVLFANAWKGRRSLQELMDSMNALTVAELNTTASKYLSVSPQIITIGNS